MAILVRVCLDGHVILSLWICGGLQRVDNVRLFVNLSLLRVYLELQHLVLILQICHLLLQLLQLLVLLLVAP